MRRRAKAATALMMAEAIAPGAIGALLPHRQTRDRDIVPKNIQDEKVKAAEAKRERKAKLLQGKIGGVP